MPILLPEDRNIMLPEMISVKRIFDRTEIRNVQQYMDDILDDAKFTSLIKPGISVAVAVGSRMIDRIDIVVCTLVKRLNDLGAKPFIVTAMGSHGGGTPQGCKSILAEYGITEEKAGCPIKADMDVVSLGFTEEGVEVCTDKNSYEADLTILVNRIKPHTEFNGAIESGLCKLATIGLGRHAGCTRLHNGGTINFDRIIPHAADMVFRRSNIGFGIGIVENAYGRICMMEGLAVDEIMTREPQLLEIAKGLMPSIGIPEMDILIVEELGKDISGIGMDPNVIGRFGPKALADYVPAIGKLIVLGISEKSNGNACGIGMADLTTMKALKSIDFESTYANSIACGCDYETEFIPLVMTDEREAIAAAIKMEKIEIPENAKIVRIKNTLQLEEIQVSRALIDYVKNHPDDFIIQE